MANIAIISLACRLGGRLSGQTPFSRRFARILSLSVQGLQGLRLPRLLRYRPLNE